MHIGIYGSGYLGTVVAACMADFGMPVTVYDEHAALSTAPFGDVPYHEKNLKDMVRRNLRAGRLLYSSNLEPSRSARRSSSWRKTTSAILKMRLRDWRSTPIRTRCSCW
jgi:UDP-glucose 6-dehydrogenase